MAGRTDAGVHALGQVAGHAGEPLPVGAWNGNLPPDVRVLASDAAPEGFDARRDATARAYAYRLYTRDPLSPFERGRALHVPQPLDRAALEACAALLPGKHDLTAFTPTQTDHVLFERNITAAEWVPRGRARARAADRGTQLHAQSGADPHRARCSRWAAAAGPSTSSRALL